MSESHAIVRTVLGDIAPGQLGPCDAHEHLFLRSPLLPGEELDDRDVVGAEAALLAAAGACAVVDWTPIALGRRPEWLHALARAARLHVVAATGFHREAHYGRGHWVRHEPHAVLVELCVEDLTRGIDGADWCGPRERPTAVRAGAVKLGAGLHAASPLERRLLAAGAEAAARTGAPVLVHAEHGTFAHELLALLRAEGVPAGRVVLAHLDRNPDPGLHAELAAAGAWLAYDGPSRVRYQPDSALIGLIETMAARGHADRLLVGGDTARRSALRAAGGGPGLDYVFRAFRPRLSRELGTGLAQQLFVDNPARAFSFSPAGAA